VKNKLFIPRRISGENSRWSDWNNIQPIIDDMKINHYDPDGRKRGIWCDFFTNGQLYFKGDYVNDEMVGYWEFYYTDGKLQSKGLYKNGLKEGEWKYYHNYDNGKLWYKDYYVNGKKRGDFING
jgi:antitoxin component YwqK of YwqJK toxin-antitoxin module